MKHVSWIVLVLVGVAALAWWWKIPAEIERQESRPLIPVTAFTVEAGKFADEVPALGTLRAWESVDISASIAQKITAIYFDDGQQVAKGDVLATLKQDEEQAMQMELEASLTDARREVRRLTNLAKKNQVAQTELDKARTLEEITGHRIEEVAARIADRTIVAPFAGVLGLRQVSEGALVVPGQRLTTLDDLSRMRLEFNVPATQLSLLTIGGQIKARSRSFEEEFTGVITAIDSRIDPVARSVIARAELGNPAGLLRPGLLMEVILVGATRQTLLVPEESLQSRGRQHYLWRLEGDSARRIPVQIGGRMPGWVEIVVGLQQGDSVVRDGVGMLPGDTAAVVVVEN